MKLKRLRRLWEQQEGQLQIQLAEALGKVSAEQAHLEYLQREIVHSGEWIFEKEMVLVYVLHRQAVYEERLRGEIEVQQLRLTRAQQELDRVREEWSSVRQEREKVERLLEKREQQNLVQERRRERYWLGDLTLMTKGPGSM